MRIAYFDAFSGIAGDMVLGALLDLGLPMSVLEEQIHKLGMPGVEVRSREVHKNGIRATKADVWIGDRKEEPGAAHGAHAHPHGEHHSYREIHERIVGANLGTQTTDYATRIFRALAVAEGRVHGKEINDVHFHEVGAFDAIVDIVGVSAGLVHFGFEKVFVSPVPAGSGFVRTDHGRMPVPAPATLELLRGHPTQPGDGTHEMVTPTGAAIIQALAETTPPPALRPVEIGYGAGDLDFKDRPNLLRLVLAETDISKRPASLPPLDGNLQSDEVLILESNIDDMNPEFFEAALKTLFAAGALDVTLQPQTMKRGRPGTCITVLAPPHLQETLETILLRETSTIGVRSWLAARKILSRRQIHVSTIYGSIEVKVVILPGGGERYTPEYADCQRVATEKQTPVSQVYDAARRAAQDRDD
jgi:uncharacterized protein (TIGR00299 family) protein